MGVDLYGKVVLLALISLVCALPLSVAEDEVTEAEVQEEFMRAFGPGLKLKERVDIFVGIVSEYPESAWADDALWVLSQIASMTAHREEAIRFRKRLLEGEEAPQLETFTRGTWIYRSSRIPAVMWVLDRTGHRYQREEAREKVLRVVPQRGKPGKVVVLVRTVPFNPLPMLLNEELAALYEQEGRDKEALCRYREALKCAPQGGLFADIYQQRIERLEQEIERKKALRGGQEAAVEEHQVGQGKENPGESKAGDAEEPQQESEGKDGQEPVASEAG